MGGGLASGSPFLSSVSLPSCCCCCCCCELCTSYLAPSKAILYPVLFYHRMCVAAATEDHSARGVLLLLLLLLQGVDAHAPEQRLARRLLVHLLGHPHGHAGLLCTVTDGVCRTQCAAVLYLRNRVSALNCLRLIHVYDPPLRLTTPVIATRGPMLGFDSVGRSLACKYLMPHHMLSSADCWRRSASRSGRRTS